MNQAEWNEHQEYLRTQGWRRKSRWDSMTERQRMEELLSGGDHEWGWYQEDVPTLIAEIDRLRALLGLPRWEGE